MPIWEIRSDEAIRHANLTGGALRYNVLCFYPSDALNYALSSYWKRYPEKYEHIKPGTVKYFDTVFDAAKAGYADYLNADHDVVIARYVNPIVGSAIAVYQTKSWWDANPYALSRNDDTEHPVVQFETVWEAQNAGYVIDCQTLLENGDLGGD